MTVNVYHYLEHAEQQAYAAYVAARAAHMEAGTHCWMRMARAQDRIKFVWVNEPTRLANVEHAIPYEDSLDGPVKVLYPAPNCVAELMLGGVHAPIEAHLEHRLLMINSDDSGDVIHKYEEGQYLKTHDVVGQYVVDYRRVHDEVMVPLTYEEAIEWIMMKGVPYEVWANHHQQNRKKFAIVHRSQIPSDRIHRNAWEFAQ